MSKNKTVPFITCACGKRGWEREEDAEKALGRARTKRKRARGQVTQRGLYLENRIYWCDEGELLHLTSQSRRENQVQRSGGQLTWDQWLQQQALEAA